MTDDDANAILQRDGAEVLRGAFDRAVTDPAQPRKSNGGEHGPRPFAPIGERVKPNFRSLADFCAEFRPISYAVVGLMREASLYTLTGRTGEGKTAFLVILALAVATGLGEKLIGRKVKKGRVAFCTAENPDDLRMRFMVACCIFNLDVRDIDRDIIISDNRVSPEDIVEWVRDMGEELALILVDTWQAYFDGRDPNNNAEAVSFTRRFRPLTLGKGQPAVVIAAHPPKQAENDSLLPYGGGGTLNEVDGNFTFRLDENGLFRLHWLGKIRGLSFDPLHFRIDKLDSPDVVTVEDQRGLSMAIGVATQFETMLRQKDVIGSWSRDARTGAETWSGPYRWDNIPGGIFRLKTSKTSSEIVRDLTKLDLLWPLLMRVPQADRQDAIVKAFGEPIRERSYRKWFREIARSADVPDAVWNMDARAGAVTEALDAGAELSQVQRAATHLSPSMTARYDRTAEAAPLAVAEARRKARKET
jgi:hypothetical protein